MTAKEKAHEFISKFGKELAPKVVDELIEAFDYQTADYGDDYPTTHKYWLEVKQQIINL
jgi:hypothetical protein